MSMGIPELNHDLWHISAGKPEDGDIGDYHSYGKTADVTVLQQRKAWIPDYWQPQYMGCRTINRISPSGPGFLSKA